MIQKITVIETNEIPLRVFKHYQSIKPNSTISYLLDNSLVLETLAQDVDESFLYPSQTWASFNTGSPYDLHKIHWYNDPKPKEFPLYWRILANNGLNIGLVNTLHSSPAKSYADSDNYKFVIPDCFAIDSYTKPSYYKDFQAFNLKATSQNSRVSTLKAPLKEAFTTVLNLPRYGISKNTIFDGINLVSKILFKKVTKERLRNLQFPLLADMFLKQLQKHEPDLSILFTNHVAANMHRYWYGLFDSDWDYKLYDNNWINKYSQEIIESLDLLDYYLKQIVQLSKKNNRILVIVSSMGQHANQHLPEGIQKLKTHDFRLENAKKLVDKLISSRFQYRVDAEMVPHYSLEFSNSIEAEKCFTEIQSSMKSLENISLKVDLNADTITLTVSLNPNAKSYSIKGKNFTHSEMGFVKFKIEDHHSGSHCPEGSLIIFNSNTSSSQTQTVDYLEYAPAMLKYFGIQKPEYMLEPSFTL